MELSLARIVPDLIVIEKKLFSFQVRVFLNGLKQINNFSITFELINFFLIFLNILSYVVTEVTYTV